MKEYVSKIVKINRPASDMYTVLSDFSVLGGMIPKDEVEDFEATQDTCSFKIKGMVVGLKIVDREPNKTIKIVGDGKLPFDFLFWIQLKEVEPYDTRLRLVLHANLNMMLSMMIGGKLQKGLDSFAEQLAMGFNGQIPPEQK